MAGFRYRLYGGATRPDAISGLDPRFSGALEQMYAAAPPEVQAQLGLTSGYRSNERQQQLWDASDKSGHMVAAPGHSKHNFGLAADLFGMGTGGGQVSAEAKDWVHSNAPKYGLAFPMAYEPWHVQLASGLGGTTDGPKGQEVYTPAPDMGSTAGILGGPAGGILGDVPQHVANYAASPDEQHSPFQKLMAGLAQYPDAPTPRLGQMGDARSSGDALLKFVQSLKGGRS